MKNQLKTVALLGLLSGILLWIGSFWGQDGIIIGLAFALVMNVGSYWFSDKIVLKMYKAKEVNEGHDLYRMVKRLTQMSGLPMPKVYIIPSNQPNAFATGRNPKNAAVAFTEGIMKALDKKELEGVAAHELAHIKNRDILITTIAATIAAVISYVAFMARWGMILGGRNDDGGSMLELIVLAIITPLMATIIQLGISRSREFMADESGANMVKDGKSLASTLQKIESYSSRVPMRMGGEATSSLFIVNPFAGRSFLKLLSTHPPTSERVEKLNSMRF